MPWLLLLLLLLFFFFNNLSCEQALHLGASREVLRERHAKGDESGEKALAGSLMTREFARKLSINVYKYVLPCVAEIVFLEITTS